MFDEKHIIINLKADTKLDVLKVIADKALELGITTNKQQLLEDLLKRESESCTGIHKGIAIPHAKSEVVSKPSVLFITLEKTVEWESLDDEPIVNVFSLLAPASDGKNSHLIMLSKLATELMEDEFIDKINSVDNIKQAYKLISNVFKGEE